MTRYLAALVMLGMTATVPAAPVGVGVVLAATNVDTADPTDGSSVFVDVYHVIIDNPNSAAVTAAEFVIPGAFIDNFDGNFRDSPDLPQFFGQPIADSFFVTPPAVVLTTREEIGPACIDVAFTLAGDTDLIPAKSTGTIVATLAVGVEEEISFGGLGVAVTLRGGVREQGLDRPIGICPEPSAALLVGLALTGCVARRG